VLEYSAGCSEEAEGGGFQDAFSLLHRLDVRSGSILWSRGVLFFTENTKVNRLVGGVVQATATLGVATEILGYLPREDLLVLVDARQAVFVRVAVDGARCLAALPGGRVLFLAGGRASHQRYRPLLMPTRSSGAVFRQCLGGPPSPLGPQTHPW